MPDKFIGCFAYERYNRPPSRIAKLPPNVAVMICKQRADTFVLPTEEERILSTIAAWKEKASALYYWDYYILTVGSLGVGCPSSTAKSSRRISAGCSTRASAASSSRRKARVAELKRMYRPATQHLNLYLTARVGWDPAVNVQDVLAEYYRLFYGPAETEMKEFSTFAETVRTKAGDRSPPIRVPARNVFPPEVLAKLGDLLTHGLAKTPEGSVYGKRVELLE